MPFAVVLGQAMTELPKDLYIPPRALEVFLEDILKEEQEGVDEISKLLRDAGSAGAIDSGAATKAGG